MNQEFAFWCAPWARGRPPPRPPPPPPPPSRGAAALLTGAAQAQDNVLVVILDDVGVDRIGAYGEHPNPGSTPTIDQLAQGGLLFRNVWVHPGCTPARASLLTGRLPSRHGLGSVLGSHTRFGLPLKEVTIPEMLEKGTRGAYTSFAVGKWHLAGAAESMQHPLNQGFDYHAGSVENISDYYSWKKYTNGAPTQSNTYATTDTANEAIDQIAAAEEPWFGWVAFNAPHTPFHAPPPELAPSFQLSGNPKQNAVEHQKAAIEAVDTELSRLLSSIDPEVLARTTIILFADNGSDGKATDAPFDPGQAKGTTYEGGVNVPFIVSGPHVSQPGSETDALVMGVDLFATVASIAGVDLGSLDLEVDSLSFLPYMTAPSLPSMRSWVFTESFIPNGPGPYVRRWIGVRNDRYKITMQRQDIPNPGVYIGFFDLSVDPFEQVNLLDGVGHVPDAYRDLLRRAWDLLGSF